MSCPEYRNALADVALGGAFAAGLRSHLAECTACREELERLRALAGAIDQGVLATVDAEPSPGFAAGVRARLAEESARGAAWWRGWIPAMAGGAAALALAAWLLWPSAPLRPPVPPKVAVEQGGPEEPAERVKDLSAEQAGVSPPSGTPNRRSPLRRVPARKAAETPALPEVLVTGDEWAQVVSFYRLAQRREIAAGELTAQDATPLEEKIKPLVIAQLDPIPPLADTPASEPRR